MRHFFGMTLCALVVSMVSATAGAQETRVPVKVVNAQRVYHPSNLKAGSTVSKLKPAVISSRRALEATFEYQRIKRESIKAGSAERRLLEVAASKKLRSAISRVVSLGGYDLVAETGAVTVAGKPLPDITQRVIDNLK